LIGIIIVVGGFLYGLSGPEEEWGSIHIVGMFLILAFLPWEILFIGKKSN